MAETGSLAAVQSAFAAALEGRGDDAIAAMIKPMDGVPAASSSIFIAIISTLPSPGPVRGCIRPFMPLWAKAFSTR